MGQEPFRHSIRTDQQVKLSVPFRFKAGQPLPANLCEADLGFAVTKLVLKIETPFDAGLTGDVGDGTTATRFLSGVALDAAAGTIYDTGEVLEEFTTADQVLIDLSGAATVGEASGYVEYLVDFHKRS